MNANGTTAKNEQRLLRCGQLLRQKVDLRRGHRRQGRGDGKGMRGGGLCLQQVNGNRNMLGPRAAGGKFGQCTVNQLVGRRCRQRHFGPIAHGFRRRALIVHLVQLPLPRRRFIQTGGQHQHRHGIAVGLPHWRHHIAQPRAGDHIGDPRLACGPGIAISHKARPLFVPRQHMGQPCFLDPAVHLLVMHAGDAKDHLYPARLEHMRNLCPQRTGLYCAH